MSIFARRPIVQAGPDDVLKALGKTLLNMQPVGSRVTCSPPPSDTDEDWLALVSGDPKDALIQAGFTQDGSPECYTGNDAGGFRSWRRGDINIVTTESVEFFDLFMTATYLAKRFNLLIKNDRIALFQAVLYGVRTPNLEARPYSELNAA